MRPLVTVTVDGKPVSGVFSQRLMSVTVMDEEGIAADRVELELANDPPAEMPEPGVIISVDMGYSDGTAFMGEFVANEIEATVLPYTLRIVGKSADVGGDAKDQKERHFDDITLGDLVQRLAGEMDLKSSVAESLASYLYEWIGQVGESNLAFLDRLARRHNALFSIKNRTIVFAVRGSGESASGKSLTPYVIRRSALVTGTARFNFSERAKYKNVVAIYMDRLSGFRREVKVPCDPEGTGTFTMDRPFASEDEANEAAKAKAKELIRMGRAFSVSVVGDPTIRGGSVVTFEDVLSEVDRVKFTVKSATHRYDKRGGYVTKITGEIKE